MKENKISALIIIFLYVISVSCKKNTPVVITGELKAWHDIIMTIDGPPTNEYDTVNPFTDYRLNVTFNNGTKEINTPGYYAADGNAAETSAREGNKWRVHFCPPVKGDWNYIISFRKGKSIAISSDLQAGDPVKCDGLKGNISISETDKIAPDFRSKGRLEYTGERYLRHAGTGEYFLKGGTDSPENLLGYKDFDGTYYGGNNKTRTGEASPNKGLHTYDPHVSDWKEGDPAWKNGKGKGIIGGLNYLSSKGANSIYFLTLNILGDGDDVWPYNDRNERYRFDCSKLDQWEIVFNHAEKLGIMLHIVLQETENQCLLDAGYVDVQRKLYLRELIARFSHHLAVTWNLGEEQHIAGFSPYGQTYRDTKLTAEYLRSNDPYKNFIVCHTHSDLEKRRKDMTEYLGFKSMEGPSLQCGDVKDVHNEALYWITASKDSLHQWVVCQDEIGQHWKGALPDSYDAAHDTIRHEVLWGNLMAGGGGVEWYFGYMYPNSDLGCEDWRSRDLLWDQTRTAIDFFHKYLPFNEMVNADNITSADNDYCLAKEGEIYAVYLPDGSPTKIELPEGQYSIQWFNPRSGGELMNGSIISISGKGLLPTGTPPVLDGKDWVCIVKSKVYKVESL
jgi:hypothetical protein